MSNRKEVYSTIKTLGLESAVKAYFGDNFTRISTNKLEKFIKKHKEERIYDTFTIPEILKLLQDKGVITQEDILSKIRD